MSEVVAKINAESTCDKNRVSVLKPLLKDSQFGAALSMEEKMKLKELLSTYSDVFASDPKKPRQNNILKHTIDTQNALPQFRKPYRVPGAYQDEVKRQVDEMLKNENYSSFCISVECSRDPCQKERQILTIRVRLPLLERRH